MRLLFKTIGGQDFCGSPVVRLVEPLRASTTGVMGLVPGQGTNIPQAAWHTLKKKKKKIERRRRIPACKGHEKEEGPQKRTGKG